MGAVHPEARARQRVQRAERSRGAAAPLRAAGAAVRRGRHGGAAAGRGLHPGARVRHAAHRRRRAGARPTADDPGGPVAHPRRHPLSHAPARMISRFELHVALRYLRSRRASRLLSLITVIAVGGVTVGVMALIVVLGVMNGLQADLRDKILVANPHLRVLTYGEGLKLDDWRKVLGEVRRDPGVNAAAPFVLTQGLISAGHDYAEGVVVYGVDPDTGRRAVTSFAQHFTKGDLTFKTTRSDVEGGIALGTRLASKLTAFPGSGVTLVAPAGAKFNPSLGAYVPKFHRYEVTGIFDTGMYEYDNSYVALDRRADPEQAQPFGLALETRLGYPYRALDWQSQNASLFSALKLEKLAMAFVVFLICVVAAFNVVGTLTMVVRDKTREIGILLAMGLKQASIRRIFLAQGILVGLTGTALGVVLGLVLGGMLNRGHWIPIDPSIYFIVHLPVHTQPLDVLLVVAASLVVATLSPLYPSLQAARLDPVTAIRYE